MEKEEKWVPVRVWKNGILHDFTGKYQVSNMGKVVSLDYMHTGKSVERKFGKFGGYNGVDLWKDGAPYVFMVHRVVWESFNGKIPEGIQVNHINENKHDNRLENLNLMSCKENQNWGTRNKRMVENRKGYGKRKPVLQYDLDGNFIKEWESGQEVKRQLGYSQGNIASCCRGIYAYAYGYKWKYKEAK